MTGLLKQLIKIVLIILSPLAPVVIALAISYAYRFYEHWKRGENIPKGSSTYKQQSFFRRIFIDLPKRHVQDIYERDPDRFNEYGIHMICGVQGSGKTITMVYMLKKWQQMYPKMKVASNIFYKDSDEHINHWKDIIRYNNGIYGQAIVLDEIQTWFSSNQSKNFPPEMLTEISQQRKQTKAIIGTAQVFGRISKPIREQTHFIYLPKTYFGCLTIVRMTQAQYYDYETQEFTKVMRRFFFVHTEEIRNAFDTYQKVEKYSKVGFNPNSINRLNVIDA